ncbi:MAG: hypothetical protein JSS10_09750 [Verrucomicrobia bacterium]|nr:hypothetical protein [Verrucomicrobiota bacterium]
MTIEFSFIKDSKTKEFSLKAAMEGDRVLPASSAKALAEIDKILHILAKNQAFSEKVERIRLLDSFTVTLKPPSSTGHYSLEIRGNILGINILKLKPETAKDLLNSTRPQTLKMKDNQPDVVELPNPDFDNPAASIPGVFDISGRRNAELLRKALESHDIPSAFKHPSDLPAPVSEFNSIKKDPSYESVAKNLQLMKFGIDKTIDRQTTPLQSMPLNRKKEMVKTLLIDLKAKVHASAEEARTLLDKISKDIYLLLESDRPVAVSFLDHILSCKTALLESPSNFIQELQQLGKALEIGLSQIKIEQLSRESEELDIKYNHARQQREGTHTFTLKELEEFLETLNDDHIQQRHVVYQNEICQKPLRTYNANLAQMGDFENYFFRRTPRSVAALKQKIAALISTFHALSNYQKWKDLNEVIIKLLALMDEASTASVWKQPILAPQIMYQGNQMKNLLEEVSKNSKEENLVKFQLLMEELFRSQTEELIRKTSKTPQDAEEALSQMRENNLISEGYNWVSAYIYKLRTENAKLQKNAESTQNMMDETSNLIKLSADLKTLRKLYQQRDAENPPSDLSKKITELESQQYILPIRCIEHHKKANLSATNPIAKKIETIHQNYSQVEKERCSLPSQWAEHEKYQQLLASY